IGRLHGAGIRLFYGHEVIYTTTNDLSETGLLRAARTAAAAQRGSNKVQVPELKAHAYDSIHVYGRRAWEQAREDKFRILYSLDRIARARHASVTQVQPSLSERNQKILVANSLGAWVEDERNYISLRLTVTLEDQGVKEESHERTGDLGTFEALEKVNLEEFAHACVDRGVRLLHADFAPAGEMPVILDNGFGGVIFHEACGHGLETTSVAKEASVFCGKLGEKIADSCVTAIDDGTMANVWGSLDVDDEGLPTQRTVLIENGVLKSYIVDQMGARQTGFAVTGSGRRQSYKFAPASRMRNTFIAAGQDRLEDMIRDVDNGLYAKSMGGGSVNSGTGDYNFGVREAYLIKNGKIDKPVKGAMLIGRGIETLGRITKVSNELKLEPGMCGSVSGSIPTMVGQPAILVSKILVGGRAR
ncbi:MAG: TldD/PmbA family protein, partial [Bdellovibrionaceae bacterium]|nr:TldD/PmbA family protein [Pseudobdellovibrionaceae bacterium]